MAPRDARRERGVAAAVWIIACVALVFLLRAASDLLIPIVIAVLISYALEPVVAWLARRSVPRMLGAGLLLGGIIALSAWGANSLRDDVRQALRALPEAAERARAFLWPDGGTSAAQQIEQAAAALQGLPAEDRAEDRARAPEERDGRTGEPAAQRNGNRAQAPSPGAVVPDWARRGVGSVLALAGHVTVVVFLVFFLLASGTHFRGRIVEIAGTSVEQRRVTASIIDDIDAQIQRFLLVRLVTAAIVALATWAVLSWMGMSQAAVWGILAGVFNSIPYFGPVIVCAGLLIVALVQSGDPMHALQVSGAALVITSLEGWLLTPMLLGKAERMHVVVVFLGVLVWTWTWGAWGTILAVPMLVVVKSIADHVDSLKPVSRLMSP